MSTVNQLKVAPTKAGQKNEEAGDAGEGDERDVGTKVEDQLEADKEADNAVERDDDSEEQDNERQRDGAVDEAANEDERRKEEKKKEEAKIREAENAAADSAAVEDAAKQGAKDILEKYKKAAERVKKCGSLDTMCTTGIDVNLLKKRLDEIGKKEITLKDHIVAYLSLFEEKQLNAVSGGGGRRRRKRSKTRRRSNKKGKRRLKKKKSRRRRRRR